MKTTATYVQITQDVPEQLTLLRRPPGIGLERWVKMESARLTAEYPKPKEDSVELGTEFAVMMDVARHERNDWNQTYELFKLLLRERMGWASRATANGQPFVERRQFHVSGYPVEPYDQDALYPL